MAQHSTFATAINCIDGRTQIPVFEWTRKHFKVDYVDMITEPGDDGELHHGPASLLDSIRNKERISIEKHNSCGIVVAGHHDCAGNPVSEEEHFNDIREAVKKIVSWDLSLPVVGLWVYPPRMNFWRQFFGTIFPSLKQWKVRVVYEKM